ncbi:hypothetical protein HDU76_005471, partial [Blyttiomyces sp. JEL0837]
MANPSNIPGEQRRLLGDDARGNQSNDEHDEEKYCSCVGVSVAMSPAGKRNSMKVLVLGAVVLIVAIGSVLVLSARPKPIRKNVIMMVSDGFGPASQTLARNFYTYINNASYSTMLPLDTILVGSSRTQSSDSFVTDSAAGATAFACALKTYNGAIGVDPEQKPCGTILEAAKAAGYMTGLVVRSRITHATPASFSAHVPDRDMESEIAMQQLGNYTLGRQVDLMFGGGMCFFKPRSGSGSCRTDDLDPMEFAKESKWAVVESFSEWNAIEANVKLPLLALLESDHLPYEIDRNPATQPSLVEMAMKAIGILDKATSKKKQGFFLMIEGSRIDMAAHSNDPAAHVREILAYNEVIEAVKHWVSHNPNTVMISTSDHETGGLSVATNPFYAWNPAALVDVQNSTEVLGKALAGYTGADFGSFVKYTVVRDWLGVEDATPEEIAFLSTPGKASYAYSGFLANMLSQRALLHWATGGHSAVDVNLYAYGLHSEKLAGNHENIDIGVFMSKFLGVNLEKITKQLLSDYFPFFAQGGKGLQESDDGYKVTHFHKGKGLKKGSGREKVFDLSLEAKNNNNKSGTENFHSDSTSMSTTTTSSAPPAAATTTPSTPSTTSTALEAFLLLAKSTKGSACVQLIQDALNAPGVFVFAELMEVQNVADIAKSEQHQAHYRLLEIFAYGTYQEYKENEVNLPPLTPAQLKKLRQLSIVTLAGQGRILPYSTLQTTLDVPHVRDLEDLIMDCIYHSILKAKLDQKKSCIVVEQTMGRDLKPGPACYEPILKVLKNWSMTVDETLKEIERQIENVTKEDLAFVNEKERFEKNFEAMKKEVKASGAGSGIGNAGGAGAAG